MKRLLVLLSLICFLFPTSVSAQTPRYNYIGPWVWDTSNWWEDFWTGPTGTLGSIDLRSTPQMGRPEDGGGGLGFFVTDRLLPSPYVLLNDGLDKFIAVPSKPYMESKWSITLEAATTRGLLWELLAEEGDATGLVRWKPLSTGSDGKIRLELGGYSPVELAEDSEAAKLHWLKYEAWFFSRH